MQLKRLTFDTDNKQMKIILTLRIAQNVKYQPKENVNGSSTYLDNFRDCFS